MAAKLLCEPVARAALGEPAQRRGRFGKREDAMTVRELLARLDHVRPVKDGWIARCPSHDDRNPSLSVSERDGRILLHCHAGCETGAILAALGLTMADLFGDSKPSNNGVGESRIVATYDYTDETGKVLYQVVRYEPKGFRQRRRNGNGEWVWNVSGVRHVPFNLPAVIKAQSVIVCEGEKDCLTAAKLGFVATCNAGGAGKWQGEYSKFLRGKRVAIIADADPPGLAHARDVARSLIGLGTSVKLIEALPEAKDLTEFCEKLPDDATRKKLLLAAIADTPELTPADVAKWQPDKPANANGFTLIPLGELLKKPDVPLEYVWDGRLVAGTVSGVFAKPKVGKGTLARNFALALSRGEEFLGLPTKQGKCIYLALEEREQDVKADFRAMGADGTEPIDVHVAAAPPEGIRALCELVLEHKPRLVVIDPIIRLARIKDEKAYGETYAVLGPLIDAARQTGTHIMFLHHSSKAPKADPTDSPLGSTALGAIPATLIYLKRAERYRTIQTVQRLGEEMPETVLQFDPDTKRLSTGGTREEAETETLSGDILDFLKAAGEPKTEPEITEAVEGKTKFVRRALRQLVEQGKVFRDGCGKRGDPYRYHFSFSCSQHIAGTREQETEKPAQTRMDIERNLVPTSEQKPILVPDIEEGQI